MTGERPPCLHCKEPSELVTGKVIYPHRKDLHGKKFWLCRPCEAHCGCHGNTTNALGYPANYQTRQARMKLHNMRLDPLWKGKKGRFKRNEVYAYMSDRMGIPRSETHTAMWTIEQCREAWVILGELWKDGRSALATLEQVIEE
ncbi:MAG: zinc-finger-containing protein [Pseudomonadota bacterium]